MNQTILRTFDADGSLVSEQITTTERLAYRPDQALEVFPIGRTLLYEKIRSGEIESFMVGRARFIPHESLIKFMEHQLAEQRGKHWKVSP